MSASPTLADLATGRDNNFNLIRMAAAVSVLVSHSWALASTADHTEPFVEATGLSLGGMAVVVFFALSGFFITKSMAERRSFVGFALARTLRIVPALFVVLAIAAFIVGPIFTTLPVADYLSSKAPYGYTVRGAILYGQRDWLPGLFAANPFPDAVNGSLWTLPLEVKCYAAVALAGLAGLLKPKLFIVPLALVLAMTAAPLWTVRVGLTDPQIAGLAFPYVLGAAAYVYRDRLPRSVWIALALTGLAIVLRSTPAFRAVFTLALAYGVLWLGGVKSPLLSYNRFGDLSYGTYIFAFLVQQSLAAAFPQMGVAAMVASALPITVVLAALSWGLVEKPALALRHPATVMIEASLARIVRRFRLQPA